jgi:hypothetical protein
MAASGGGVDHRLDGARIDGALDEHGRHLARDNHIDDLANIGDPRLALGRDALDARHLDTVGPAVIGEGVMSGHQDALPGGDCRHAGAHPGVQRRQFGGIGGGPRLHRSGAVRHYLAKQFGDHRRGQRPLRHVHPDMRVRVVRTGEGQQPLRRHRRLGHSHGRAAVGQLAQNLAQLALQVVARIEDRVGREQQPHIASAGLVEMGVGARPHHRLDRDTVAGHVPGHIGQHPDRRHRLRPGTRGGRHSHQRHGSGQGFQYSNHSHSPVVQQEIPDSNRLWLKYRQHPTIFSMD